MRRFVQPDGSEIVDQMEWPRPVWRMPDGGIHERTPTRACPVEWSDAEYLESVKAAALVKKPILQTWGFLGFVAADAFPRLRSFRIQGQAGSDASVVCPRNCWRWVNGQVQPSMPLVRADYFRVLRLERNRRLTDSDGMIARGVEKEMPLAFWRDAIRASGDGEADVRAIYADWLEERGNMAEATEQRKLALWKIHRQQLRDLPATVQADLAALTTPEQLEQYQPPWPVPPS